MDPSGKIEGGGSGVPPPSLLDHLAKPGCPGIKPDPGSKIFMTIMMVIEMLSRITHVLM
jgi:hypothetical protein